MDYLVLPRVRRVEGAVRAPPSKSATNRALLLAALGSAPVELARPLASEDTAALRRCLAAMGARIEAGPEGLRICGPLSGSGASEAVLDAGDSGTAARFLAAAAAATPGRFRLDGSARLRERPMAELLAALREAGASIQCPGREGFLPLSIAGSRLSPASLTVDASRSSQFLSALLLAAVSVEGGWTVRPSGPVASAPYVEATIEALEAFGHRVLRDAGAITVTRGHQAPHRYEVPGDHSSALPLLAAAGAAGGEVVVLGVCAASAAADARALPVLEKMGIVVTAGADRIKASFSGGAPGPVEVEAGEFPDAVPVLAALASLAPGESRFSGIGHLRWKESDRIAALAALISAAGGAAVARESELVVAGGIHPVAARLPTFRDHRLAMAAALLSIASGGCLIENPGCVAKSYPSFFEDLQSLFR